MNNWFAAVFCNIPVQAAESQSQSLTLHSQEGQTRVRERVDDKIKVETQAGVRDIEEDRAQNEGTAIFRKESKRQLKIAAVGSDDERIKQVIRQDLKTNDDKREKVCDFLSQARARAVKCPPPTFKLRLIKRFFYVSLWLHLSRVACHATFRTKETKPSCVRGS